MAIIHIADEPTARGVTDRRRSTKGRRRFLLHMRNDATPDVVDTGLLSAATHAAALIGIRDEGGRRLRHTPKTKKSHLIPSRLDSAADQEIDHV